MESKIFAVIGSRRFTDYQYLDSELDKYKIGKIVSGGAIGADSLAMDYANKHNIVIDEIKPDYNKFGRSAPIIRNLEIVRSVDIVIAFWDGKSRGTNDAIEKARKLGKEVVICIVKL